MPRGRPALVIDKAEFQKCINSIEADASFQTRAALWDAVAASPWAKKLTPRPLTAQVAMIRAQEMGLEIKTPKGKRGREPGERPVSAGKGRVRKKMTPEQALALRRGFHKDEREALEKTFLKAENGSLVAKIKLMCLDCTGNQKKEIAYCPCTNCPLHTVRPYKRDGVYELEVIGESEKE